ncbi:prolyl-tRNA synthetase [Carbonactinospora thermoautotrophica]|uniref:Prolyl-tRNA synthetase n=1 Tax=Carbonactinospora thermoautotrophica TaxID=1469144 RepID=A0A132MRD2_9ACTN|nr:YbaK/EbsC family protein [Carbonactinospora thermoautotrophica]KWX00306.1 prolyl-tRNA synthetase [Carbonactinospora thermoautotrophica]KWX10526.1 prolyl-tRNA synthetase [Carbonactinospora thermoautotrophica]
MHPNVERVAKALAEAGARGQVKELDGSARTAAEAAAQLGCEVGAIVKSLVFEADGEPLLILTSGGHQVDTARVAADHGFTEVKRADPEFVREHTGFPIGGVAPLGHPKPLRTLIDVALKRYDEVWAAAGHPYAVFPTTFDELARITGGTPAEVGD